MIAYVYLRDGAVHRHDDVLDARVAEGVVRITFTNSGVVYPLDVVQRAETFE